MTVELKPVGYRVLIKPDSLEEITETGIVLVHKDELAAKAATVRGTIVAIGPEAWTGMEPWVAVGDRVQYAKYAGKMVDDPDDPNNPYLVINDEDVLLKIEGEEL